MSEDVEDAPYDAGDPDAVNTARKKSGRRRAERLRVVEAIRKLPDGRSWMYGLLERCHIYHTSFVQGDAHATSFKEGERNVGLMLVADIMSACPEQYPVMCREAKREGK